MLRRYDIIDTEPKDPEAPVVGRVTLNIDNDYVNQAMPKGLRWRDIENAISDALESVTVTGGRVVVEREG